MSQSGCGPDQRSGCVPGLLRFSWPSRGPLTDDQSDCTHVFSDTVGNGPGQNQKTKGAGGKQPGLARALKQAKVEQERWKRMRAPHLVALVHTGVDFKDGEQVKEDEIVIVTVGNVGHRRDGSR